MVYNVIGVMSGSSLDGLDIAYVEITEIGGQWSFELLHSQCHPYEASLYNDLKNVMSLPLSQFLELHTRLGRYIGEQINIFIEKNKLEHKVHLIASHGHTAYHNPANHTSFQLGDGATIAAVTQLNVVSDLRNKDVALHGQGAPIVPIADRYFWNDYDFCLNIGGIANVTINSDTPQAFDICTANQVLNHFAQSQGLAFDTDGQLAQSGQVSSDLLAVLNQHDYFQQPGPKSLSNTFAQFYIDTLQKLSAADAIATMTEHIAVQVAQHLQAFITHPSQKLLITGGGAHNKYLIERIQYHCGDLNIDILDPQIVDFKEAIAMALIGVLRWREETNVLSSVTGATTDSVGGALWVN